jgi:hypothetical protein
VEFCGQDTQTDEVGHGSAFIDLWLDAEQARRVEEAGIGVGDYVWVESVVPFNEGEDDDVVVRFLSGGDIRRLEGTEAARVEVAIRTRLHTEEAAGLDMAGVQAAIAMVEMDGTFEYQSQGQGGAPSRQESAPLQGETAPQPDREQLEGGASQVATLPKAASLPEATHIPQDATPLQEAAPAPAPAPAPAHAPALSAPLRRRSAPAAQAAPAPH